jgi:hypothetical protein
MMLRSVVLILSFSLIALRSYAQRDSYVEHNVTFTLNGITPSEAERAVVSVNYYHPDTHTVYPNRVREAAQWYLQWASKGVAIVRAEHPDYETEEQRYEFGFLNMRVSPSFTFTMRRKGTPEQRPPQDSVVLGMLYIDDHTRDSIILVCKQLGLAIVDRHACNSAPYATPYGNIVTVKAQMPFLPFADPYIEKLRGIFATHRVGYAYASAIKGHMFDWGVCHVHSNWLHFSHYHVPSANSDLAVIRSHPAVKSVTINEQYRAVAVELHPGTTTGIEEVMREFEQLSSVGMIRIELIQPMTHD